MRKLSQAIALAAEAHADQIDKCGEPYILHALRVMLAVSPKARIAAVLHDVLEDTAINVDELRRRGFIGPSLGAVLALTRMHGKPYPAFIARCALNEIAREVKIADIQDDLSPIRTGRLPPQERESLGERYRKALAVLCDTQGDHDANRGSAGRPDAGLSS